MPILRGSVTMQGGSLRSAGGGTRVFLQDRWRFDLQRHACADDVQAAPVLLNPHDRERSR